MKRIFTFITTALLLYFGINWIADNPKAMRQIRTIMNNGVAAGAEKAEEALSDVQSSASQSLDK